MADGDGGMKIRGPFLELDPSLIAQGISLPGVQPRTYSLLDNDAQVCRIIAEDELEASYVDNNITTYQLADVNPVILDVDNELVQLNYSWGGQTAIQLGIIDWDAALRAPQYVKMSGIIYPIDESGNLMLNKVNTPNLVNIRLRYHDLATQASATNVKYAEIVYAFTETLALASHLDGIQ